MKTTLSDAQPDTANRTSGGGRDSDTTDTDHGPVLDVLCTVRLPMNSHGALLLESLSHQRTYCVVEYATSGIRASMSRLDRGTVIRVSLAHLTGRGCMWRATGVHAAAPGTLARGRHRVDYEAGLSPRR